MAGNFLEKIMALGMGQPLLYWPGHDAANNAALAWCQYSGTPTLTSLGTAQPTQSGNGAFTNSDLPDFNGSSSRVEFPNFGNLLSGIGAVTLLAWITPDNTSSGGRSIVEVRTGAPNERAIARLYQNGTSAGVEARSRDADSTPGTPASSTLVAGENRLFAGVISPHLRAAAVEVGAGFQQVSANGMGQNDFENLDNLSLFVGGASTADRYFPGIVHNVVVLRGVLDQQQHADLQTADSLGQWCQIDLAASGLFKNSAGATLTATGLEFQLRKTGPTGTIVDAGNDLDVSAGATTRKFYAPGLSASVGDYWLAVRDSVNGEWRGDYVPLVAA